MRLILDYAPEGLFFCSDHFFLDSKVEGLIGNLSEYNPDHNKDREVRFQDNPIFSGLEQSFKRMKDTFVNIFDWYFKENGDLVVKAGMGISTKDQSMWNHTPIIQIPKNSSDADILKVFRLAVEKCLTIQPI